MNTMQLGDYRGGRDSITNLMGAEIPQLKNINQAALTFGALGVQGMIGGHRAQQKADNELRNAMILRRQSLADQMGIAENNYEFQRQAAAEKQAQMMGMEDDAMAGQEAAMMDWAKNVINLYEPNSPERKQAEATLGMLQQRPRGNTAFNKGYSTFINERNIGDMMNQGAAGAAGYQQGKMPSAPKPVPAAKQKALPKPTGGSWSQIDANLHT